MTTLADPLRLGPATARNRVVFGPHETNLGRRRSLSRRHVAYYRARAAGGAGVVVVEEASVHPSDWPYERAPLAAECAEGWAEVAVACHEEGALVLAALGHAGGQGSSAYHQSALWGPSRVPDVVSREVPKEMEAADLADLVAGFGAAARLALEAGCDGVEVNAGQYSLLRQFASGLTNHRRDRYGQDRLRLLAEVLEEVRREAPGGVLGLRISCDELAPWAGIVPDQAVAALGRLAGGERAGFDYATVVTGSAFATAATRPDSHVPAGFNRHLAAAVRRALPAGVAVVAQGSIVDPQLAREIVGAGEADAVEMTRAQIADAAAAGKLVAGEDDAVRPCVLCNQSCQVRDVRNPIVSCIGEPRSGYEDLEPDPDGLGGLLPGRGRHLLVVGAGPAGLECARVAALAGFAVTLLERGDSAGGMAAAAAARLPGRERLGGLVLFLERSCRLLGVELAYGEEATLERLDAHEGPVVLCTGSRPGRATYEAVAPAPVTSAAEVLAAERLPGAPVPAAAVVSDPVGGPVGVGVAELLAGFGSAVTLVTPDFVAGEQLARSGDLAPANVRLARAGVEVAIHSLVRSVSAQAVTIEDRFSGRRRVVPGALLVDAGHRLADDALWRACLASAGRKPDRLWLAGDAVAPRTIHEAVLEGRWAALGLAGASRPPAPLDQAVAP